MPIGYYGGMMQATRYRMYVDESGDDVMEPGKWNSPDDRYLGLTGVVVDKAIYRAKSHPALWRLKQEFFPHDPDEPVILVRSRIINKLGPFGVLDNQEIAARWEERIIRFLGEYVIQIFTVVIDKQAHWGRFGPTAVHPYHYCATVLTERYGRWLGRVGGVGDVMFESRGGREDMELKSAFNQFMVNGPPDTWAARQQISSNQLKLKQKAANITGLQLADLVAYPGRKGVLLAQGRALATPPGLVTRRFIEAIQPKYGQDGEILLP